MCCVPPVQDPSTPLPPPCPQEPSSQEAQPPSRPRPLPLFPRPCPTCPTLRQCTFPAPRAAPLWPRCPSLPPGASFLFPAPPRSRLPFPAPLNPVPVPATLAPPLPFPCARGACAQPRTLSRPALPYSRPLPSECCAPGPSAPGLSLCPPSLALLPDSPVPFAPCDSRHPVAPDSRPYANRANALPSARPITLYPHSCEVRLQARPSP